jgi:hypothetical protein
MVQSVDMFEFQMQALHDGVQTGYVLLGNGNVCVSLCLDRRINVLSSSCTVHAMQSKPTLSLIVFQDNDGDFLDYA